MRLSPFRSLRPAGTCTPLRARDWPEAGRRVASGGEGVPAVPATTDEGRRHHVFDQDTTNITGAALRAVLYALAHYADRGGCNAFPSQARIADHAGVHVRTVRRALGKLQELGLIVRTGGVRSRRGRPVAVWRIMLGRLKPDMRSGLSIKPQKKQQARQGKRGGEAAAWAILASQYGWATLQKWSEPAIRAALDRICASQGEPALM